jgi:hypothetical protein
MHDTACCFGYPSDSSRTARKRAGTLGWVELRRASPPPTRNLWHSLAGSRRCHLRHRPRPPRVAGRGATTAGPARGGSGWRGPGRSGHGWIATSTARGGCGSVGPDLSLARLLGGRLVLLIASSARLRWPGFTGSGAVCARGSRVRGAGPVTGVSAGLECRVHQIASSARLRWPGDTGSGAVRIPLLRVGPCQRAGQVGLPPASRRSGTSRPGQSGRRAEAGVWGCGGAIPAGGHRSDGRGLYWAQAQLSRSTTRTLRAKGPAGGGWRPGARLDRGLGVGSSTGSLQSR